MSAFKTLFQTQPKPKPKPEFGYRLKQDAPQEVIRKAHCSIPFYNLKTCLIDDVRVLPNTNSNNPSQFPSSPVPQLPKK